MTVRSISLHRIVQWCIMDKDTKEVLIWWMNADHKPSMNQLAKQLGVSRQRVWQLVKQLEGNCMICGKKRNPFSKVHCDEHILYNRKRVRKQRGCQPWRPGKVGRPVYSNVGK